jgi:hypothetical protein
MATKAANSVNNNNVKSNTNNSSSSPNANSINAKYFQHKLRISKASNKDEQQDGLIFEELLKSDKGQNHVMVNALQEQQRNSQQFTQQQDEEKKDSYKTDALKAIENKNVVEAGVAEKTHTAEFCKALTDNQNKHNFEVTIPQLGQFKIQTNTTGKQLKFDVSTGEKGAFDWLSKNQSDIEENVGKDLNLEVILGIEYAV